MQYGHKQAWQTKAIGLAVVIGVNALAGYALVSGLAQRVTAAVITEVEAVVIEEAPPPPDELPPPPPPDLDVPPPPVFEVPIVNFTTPPANTTAIQVERGDPEAAPPPPPAPTGPTHGPQRRVRRGELPPYPEASLRLEETGVTTVRVCADIEGGVTSVETVNSSGHTRLDRAAEQWLRRGRYDPAQQNGVAVAGCADTEVEWVLPS